MDQTEVKRTLKDLAEDTIACNNCSYFEAFAEQKRQDNRIGACKCNPPVPATEYSKQKMGVWPLTTATFWCGMFQNKHGVGVIDSR
jgi:hypothetical protein